jgi:hypothetical protein
MKVVELSVNHFENFVEMAGEEKFAPESTEGRMEWG